jgi:hypothetical protein
LEVIGATGGLERPAARLLSAAGIAVAVVNPRQTRQVAKGLGWLAKTDRRDPRMLARYGALARPPRARRLARRRPACTPWCCAGARKARADRCQRKLLVILDACCTTAPPGTPTTPSQKPLHSRRHLFPSAASACSTLSALAVAADLGAPA